MSVGVTVSGFLDNLSRLNLQQLSLRLVVLVAPMVALVAEARAGAHVQTWFIVLVVIFCAVSALLPDSHTGLLVVLTVGLHWALALRDVTSAWVLVAALALLVFHVAGVLASYGPTSVVLDPLLLALWLGRSGVAAAVTALVWLATRVGSGLDLPANGLVLGAALLVVAGWTFLLAHRLVSTR